MKDENCQMDTEMILAIIVVGDLAYYLYTRDKLIHNLEL